MKKLLLSFGRKAGLVLLVAASMAVTSCRTSSSAMPPIPEVYEGDTVEECYYIVGTLTSSGSALGGATVSAGGATATTASTGEYRLTIEKENFATKTVVKFSKSDYLTIESTAVFPSSATGTKVTLDATLTRKAAAVTIVAGEAISVGEDSSTAEATITIESDVVTAGTTLSTTPYTPGNTEEVASTETTDAEKTINDVSAPAAVLAMEFSEPIDDDKTFTINMPLNNSALTKAASEGYAFSDVTAVKYENSAWTALANGTPTFLESHYEVTVKGSDLTNGTSINVSISPSFTVVASDRSYTTISSTEIDNIGKTAIVSQDITYSMNQGLEYDSITCTDADYCSTTIKSEMATYLATMLAASFDNSKVDFTETVTVSGDTKVSVVFNQSYRTYSITASVCSIDSDGKLVDDAKSVTYSAKYYGAVTRGVEEEAGDLGFTHND